MSLGMSPSRMMPRPTSRPFERGQNERELAGDVYTARIKLSDDVIALGDYDRDGDVDMDDLGGFNLCSGTPLPCECEILDANRNNVLDNEDPSLLMEHCFTGGGESAGGGGMESSESGESSDSDAGLIEWCMSHMTASQRADFAGLTRERAESFSGDQRERMLAFADAIDPQEQE